MVLTFNGGAFPPQARWPFLGFKSFDQVQGWEGERSPVSAVSLELCLRDRKFAVRFTSEDVKLTNLLIEDSGQTKEDICLGLGNGDDKEEDINRIIYMGSIRQTKLKGF